MEPHEIDRAASIWDSGNYPSLAARLAPAAHQLAKTIGPGPEKTALDIATGTGSLARELARQQWATTGIDIAPGLLHEAEKTAQAENLDITWRNAPLDDLPMADHTIDLVASSFGIIFAPDPAAALTETHRVLRPGGTLALAVWPSTGHMAQMSTVMEPFVNYPLSGPFRWGDTDVLRTWLEPNFRHPAISNGYLTWQFPSPEAYIDYMLENSPGHVATMRAAADSAPQLRQALIEFAQESASQSGNIDLSLEFFTVTAQRRDS